MRLTRLHRAKNSLNFVYGSVLVVLVATTAVAVSVGFQFFGKSALAIRSRDALFALDEYRASVVMAESAQRGYVVTGKPSYLSGYDRNVHEASSNLATLDDLTT